MSIEKDRDYFNKHIKDTYGHTVGWDNGLPVAALDLMMWNIWQASANREGYKLVPVEPTKDMLNSGYRVKHDKIIDLGSVYKAMIGACDDH